MLSAIIGKKILHLSCMGESWMFSLGWKNPAKEYVAFAYIFCFHWILINQKINAVDLPI